MAKKQTKTKKEINRKNIQIPYEGVFKTSTYHKSSYATFVKNALYEYFHGNRAIDNYLEKNKNVDINFIIKSIITDKDYDTLLCNIYLKLHDCDRDDQQNNNLSGLQSYIQFIKKYYENNNIVPQTKTIDKNIEENINKFKREFYQKDIKDNFKSRLKTQDRITTQKCWFPIKSLTDEVCKKLDPNAKSSMTNQIGKDCENIFFIGQDLRKTIHYIKLKQITKLEFNGKGNAKFYAPDAHNNECEYKLCTKSFINDGHEVIIPATRAYTISLLHIDHDPEISVVISKSIWPRLRILKAEMQNAMKAQGVKKIKQKDAYSKIKQYWETNGYPQIPGLLDEIKDLHDCMTLTVLEGADNLAKNNKEASKIITDTSSTGNLVDNNENYSYDEEKNVKKKIANSVSPDLKLEQLYGIIGIERTKKKFE